MLSPYSSRLKKLHNLSFVGGAGKAIGVDANEDDLVLIAVGGGGGVSDGDKGDITISGVGTVYTIDAGVVTLAKQANMATGSLVYRKTAGAGVPEVNTLATLKTDLLLTGTNSGDQTTITGNAGTATALQTARNINGVAFDGTAAITINAVDVTARAAAATTISTTAPLTGGGDLSANRTFAVSAATTGAAGSMSAADKTKLDGVATAATANSTDAFLLARANHTGTQAIATILAAATSRFFGRITAAGGVGEEMTGTQATTLLDTATSALKGLAPPSGGGTVNYLRADGTWTAPPGTGGVPDGDKGDITVTASGATWTIDAGVVTLAKQADMATASVVYRKTAAAGAPEVQTLATLKTDLALTGTNSGDQASIVGITGTIAQFNTAITDGDLATGGGTATGTNTGDQTTVSGNAGTATTLQTSRNINGIAFNGSANITINAVDATARAATATTISTTAPLTGGGDLSANRTLAIDAATGALPGSMSAQDKTRLDAAFTRYHSLLDCSGSHIAGRVAGTYGMGQGDALAVNGTGTLYPLNSIYIAAADYPAAGTLAAKLRIRATLYVNDVAPTGTFTFGLHPITRPATSGGAGLNIFTIGAAVASSTITISLPAADSMNTAVTAADFALPADGHYIIGVLTTTTVAVSSHIHISAILQMRYA